MSIEELKSSIIAGGINPLEVNGNEHIFCFHDFMIDYDPWKKIYNVSFSIYFKDGDIIDVYLDVAKDAINLVKELI